MLGSGGVRISGKFGSGSTIEIYKVKFKGCVTGGGGGVGVRG